MAHTLVEIRDFAEAMLLRILEKVGGTVREIRILQGRRGRDEMVVYELERRKEHCDVSVARKHRNSPDEVDWVFVDCDFTLWRRNTLYTEVVAFLNQEVESGGKEE